MAAGEYEIAEGIKVIVDETTHRYHTYRAEDDEGYISFRIQGDENACWQVAVDMTAWLHERQEAFLVQQSGTGPAPANDVP